MLYFQSNSTISLLKKDYKNTSRKSFVYLLLFFRINRRKRLSDFPVTVCKQVVLYDVTQVVDTTF